MKKVLLFGIMFAVVFLTGCQKTTRLVCSQSVTSSGLEVSVDMIADFGEEELVYLGLEYGMDLSAYTDAQVDLINKQDMCSSVKANMSSYAEAFTNCKQSVSNKKLKITADFDLDKLMNSGLSRKTNADEAKTVLEKQGYTCVIK